MVLKLLHFVKNSLTIWKKCHVLVVMSWLLVILILILWIVLSIINLLTFLILLISFNTLICLHIAAAICWTISLPGCITWCILVYNTVSQHLRNQISFVNILHQKFGWMSIIGRSTITNNRPTLCHPSITIINNRPTLWHPSITII